MKSSGSPKIIAVAGPKGGCGKTILSAGLARVLASQGNHVLLVDLDQFGQNAAFSLDVTPDEVAIENTPPMSVRAYSNNDNIVNDCPASGHQPLTLRRTPYKTLSLTSPPLDDIPALIERFRTYQTDIVIVDMAPRYHFADIFDAADQAILVATPEPASIFSATQWIRYVISNRFVEDHILAAACQGPSWRFDSALSQLPENLHTRFLNSVTSKQIHFVLNQRREGSEITQAQALCHAWSVLLGPDVRFLGSLHFEERRWFYTRKFTPDDPLAQEESIRSELETIAHLLTAHDFPKRPCLALAQPLRDARDFLTLAQDEEPRHAYRRLYEGYRRENGLVSWAVPPDFLRKMMNSLDAAWQHLHHELTHSQETPCVSKPKISSVDAPPKNLPAVTRRLSGTFARVSDYNPEHSELNAGQWLRAARENTGTSIPELACKTRIPIKILDQIENRDIKNITPSHLQAFLFEITKALGLPLDEVRTKFGFK